MDIYLHCSHLSAIVNNAAMKTGIVFKYLFETLLSISFGICPEVELLQHTVNSIFRSQTPF